MLRAAAANRRTGRRAGETSSKAAILQAARSLFSELGYEGTTIRAIAREAGVDPALIHYFFASKEGVFEAVVHSAIQVADVLGPVLDGELDGLAERLLRAYLSLWEGTAGDGLAAILRSTLAKGGGTTSLQVSVTPAGLVTRLAKVIGGRDAELRACLITSQLLGVAVQRYVVRTGPLVDADLERVVRRAAPSLQALIRHP